MLQTVRYWLIRWLSCGDLLLVNFEIDDAGTLRTKEAGGLLIANGNVRTWSRDFCLGINAGSGQSSLAIETTRTQKALFTELLVENTSA